MSRSCYSDSSVDEDVSSGGFSAVSFAASFGGSSVDFSAAFSDGSFAASFGGSSAASLVGSFDSSSGTLGDAALAF